MNYLGHAFLSFGDEEILTGNMIGDHIKGSNVLQQFPSRIARGIMLHRHIDTYTDQHPASSRAKILFRETYGLYAGAIVDCLYDHFLANDPKYFLSDKALMDFSQKTYQLLESQQAYFPEKFAVYFPYMRDQNWLYNYRNLQGMQRSLKGLEKRAKFIGSIDKAYEIFIGYYYQLAQCYYELMDDIIKVVKTELTSNNDL